jgi:hypothetical protein
VNDHYWDDQQGIEVNPLRILQPVLELVDDELGGIVRLGLHDYIVPAGAIHEDRLFTLAYASLTGVAVDCGPSPYSFDAPVRLELSYLGTQYALPRADPSRLQIWYAAPDGQFIALASHVDRSRMIVWAEVDHFSRYILG